MSTQRKLIIAVAALLIGGGLVCGYLASQPSVFQKISHHHTTIDVSSVGPWKVTSESSSWSSGRSFCRAVGLFPDAVEITIIARKKRSVVGLYPEGARQVLASEEREGLWYIGKRGGQLKLPENTKTAVQIVAEGGSVATGELRGGIGQRQEFWSIFQFQPADQVIPALREGKTLRVKGDDKLFPAFTLPIAADIIKALDRCIRR